MSGYTFVIAGDGSQFEKLVEASKVSPNLIIPGRIGIEEIAHLLKLTDYYIVPLKDLIDFRLSLPNKFFDAISAGLPIITSSEGTLKRVITEEQIGHYYSNLDPSSLQRLLEELIFEDTIAMRQRAKTLSQGKFSFDGNYSSLIEKLVLLSK